MRVQQFAYEVQGGQSEAAELDDCQDSTTVIVPQPVQEEDTEDKKDGSYEKTGPAHCAHYDGLPAEVCGYRETAVSPEG